MNNQWFVFLEDHLPNQPYLWEHWIYINIQMRISDTVEAAILYFDKEIHNPIDGRYIAWSINENINTARLYTIEKGIVICDKSWRLIDHDLRVIDPKYAIPELEEKVARIATELNNADSPAYFKHILMEALKQQDKDTRLYCAEKILLIKAPVGKHNNVGSMVFRKIIQQCYELVMNA